MSEDIDKSKKELVGKLESLGLSTKESEIYLALIKLGEVTSGAIIESTGLNRQFVYEALNNLEKRGLAQHIVKSGWKRFSAKNPKLLERLIARQQKIAAEVVDEIQKFYTLPLHQEFEVFQGSESYIAHEFDLLEQAKEGSALMVIGGTGDKFYAAMGAKLSLYEVLRIKKKIAVRYIGSEGQRDYLSKSRSERRFFEYRLLPGLFTGAVNTNIWPDVLGFNIFGDPITSFVISNPVIARSYSQFFETLWKLGEAERHAV